MILARYVSSGYLARSACSTLSSIGKGDSEAIAARILSSTWYAQGNACLNAKIAKIRFGTDSFSSSIGCFLLVGRSATMPDSLMPVEPAVEFGSWSMSFEDICVVLLSNNGSGAPPTLPGPLLEKEDDSRIHIVIDNRQKIFLILPNFFKSLCTLDKTRVGQITSFPVWYQVEL